MKVEFPEGAVTDLERRVKEGDATELYAYLPGFIDTNGQNPSKITRVEKTSDLINGFVIHMPDGNRWYAREDGTVPFGDVNGFIFDNYWLAYAYWCMVKNDKQTGPNTIPG